MHMPMHVHMHMHKQPRAVLRSGQPVSPSTGRRMRWGPIRVWPPFFMSPPFCCGLSPYLLLLLLLLCLRRLFLLLRPFVAAALLPSCSSLRCAGFV